MHKSSPRDTDSVGYFGQHFLAEGVELFSTLRR